MRRLASALATLVISLAALVGLIALINSRDKAGIDQQNSARAAGPGDRYRGDPPLTPSLRHAVALGNVVVFYRQTAPRRLVQPGGRQLEQVGQAVLLKHQPRLTVPLAAVAANRVQPANTPAELQQFIDYWLGR